MSRRILPWMVALGTVCLLAGCGDDGEPSGTQPPPAVAELNTTGVGKYLGLMPDSVQHVGDWDEYHYDTAKEKAICLRGDPYQVNVRRGTVNKVLLYLEGGGACWSYSTCYQAAIAKTTAGSALAGGIIDKDSPKNPFRDWTVVYGSYCDGSVWAGDNTLSYNNRRTFHHGLYNLSAAVSLMLRDFPNPERIVVSGSSAGGFGTYTGYGVTRVAFPTTEILVFDDSGPGLQNNNEMQAVQDRLTNWKFQQVVPATCTQCSTQLTYLTDWAVERDPMLRVAFFDYQEDSVLRFFFNIGPDDFRALLLSVTGEVQGRFPTRIKRFMPRGESHTVLELPSFFTVALEDTTVRDWTVGFLANDQSAWRDLVEP
ncbi:MAG: hypothetical protein HY270_11505 [Deltaproteobacteria bacterium]|nr:hypothetical protein [Deltaproteobacteria bacterium]